MSNDRKDGVEYIMISSESNAQVKSILKLQRSARERRKQGLFVAEGIKLVKEAAQYGKLRQVYFSESYMENTEGREKEIWENVSSEIVADSVFHVMTETVTPQGVMGLVSLPSYSIDEILQDKRRSFLLLDDLRDPGNLGTIMRTAEGADMSGVILSKGSVDLFNPKVVRATMGAIFRVPFFYAEELIAVMERLKQMDIPVYGTMLQGSVLYDEPDYCRGAAIVVGNEANGISEKVAEQLSVRVRIPMAGNLESLNAAVAAAILMYEVSRQKRQ